MLGIVGQGFVGTAVREGFRKDFPIMTYDSKYLEVVIYDKDKGYWTRKDDPIKELVGSCGLIFLCLPTPMNPDGSCNTSIVEVVLSKISNAAAYKNGRTNVCIKSTIPPGSVEKWNQVHFGLDICFYPEFLREATAEDDFKNQKFIIAGGADPAVKALMKVCKKTFPNATFFEVPSTVAEMIKLTVNCFLACKVSFANEIKQICDKLNISYDDMMAVAKMDGRMGESHWQVPGPMKADDGSGKLLCGFSGSCFIKDINSLIDIAYSLGVDPKMLRAAWEKNLEVRPERDWEHLVARAVTNGRTNNEQTETVGLS